MAAAEETNTSGIVWETPENPPKPQDYIFHQGKRLVQPYYFEFIAHVKKRWAGKKVVDLFAHEFRQRPYEYYVEAVQSGRIRVNGKSISADYIAKVSEKLSHFVHRHEPPVRAKPIMVLEEASDVVTICKPSSIPVHPCGQYRKNTVVGILQAEHGIAPLFPIHRLDRLVSGLLILAKNAATADRFRQEIEAGKVRKEYVAKVRGVFPVEEVEIDANVIYDAREGKSTTEVGEGINGKLNKGKPACTKFVRLHTDGVFSIVKCVPVNGRTHQIRVHLQHLGHPIANDALYSFANPSSRSVQGTSADQAARRSQTVVCDFRESKLCSSASSEQFEKVGILLNEDPNEENSGTGSCSIKNTVHVLGETNKRQKVEGKSVTNETAGHFIKRDPYVDFRNGDTETDKRFDMGHLESSEVLFSIDPICTNCPNVAPAGYDEHEEGLWLHCVRYSGPGWAYECPIPEWALI